MVLSLVDVDVNVNADDVAATRKYAFLSTKVKGKHNKVRTPKMDGVSIG